MPSNRTHASQLSDDYKLERINETQFKILCIDLQFILQIIIKGHVLRHAPHFSRHKVRLGSACHAQLG